MKRWIYITIALFVSTPLWAADEKASLQWSHRVEISVPVSGVVRAVNVDVGDLVKKGQVLLALDNAIYQAKVAEIQAAIIRLLAEAAEAKREFERIEELYTRTVVATAELDQARLRLVKTDSLVAEARANLKQQQKVLEDSSVRAPFDAVVVERQVEPGMSVASTLQPQILLVLGKSGEMLARMHLTTAQIEKLKIGQVVAVVTGGQSYQGKIKALGLEPSKGNGDSLYVVEVLFSSSEQLRAGTTAVVKFP